MRTMLRLVSLARAPVFATLFAFTPATFAQSQSARSAQGFPPKLVREARIQAD